MTVTDRLSISKAWDETKARVSADGRLLTIVALALIAFPAAIGAFLFPATEEVQRGAIFARSPGSAGEVLVMIVVAVVGIIGQLAIVRLAIGPSVTVGDAIRHGASRTLPYIGAAILMILAAIVIALPMIGLLAALGVRFEEGAQPPGGAAVVVMLLFFVLFLYLAVRMMMTSPVASAERAGPIEIIKRSWKLTAGHWWRLFGFVFLFFLAVVIALSAIMVALNLLITLASGPIEPHSAGALIVALVEALVSALATTLFMVMLARVYVQLAGEPAATASVPSSGT